MPYFHLDDDPFPCNEVNKIYRCKDAIVFAANEEEAKFVSSSDNVIELTGEEAEIAKNEFLERALKRHEQVINGLTLKLNSYGNRRKIFSY